MCPPAVYGSSEASGQQEAVNWGRQKLYMDFQLHMGSPPHPFFFKGQLYIFTWLKTKMVEQAYARGCHPITPSHLPHYHHHLHPLFCFFSVSSQSLFMQIQATVNKYLYFVFLP